MSNLVLIRGRRLLTLAILKRTRTKIIQPAPEHNVVRDKSQLSIAEQLAEPFDASPKHRLQVEQTIRAIPFLLVFHGVAAICLKQITSESSIGLVRDVWPIASLLVGLAFAAIYILWNRGLSLANEKKVQGALELLGLIFALVWATPTAAYAASQVLYPILPVMAVSVTMMGVTVFSLLRQPIAAIVFTALLTATLSRSAYLAVGENNVLATIVTMIYGFVLIGMIFNSYKEFSSRIKAEARSERQAQTIKLLLNDFERGTSDWLWETDLRGMLTYHSPRFDTLMERPAGSLIGQSMMALLVKCLEPVSWQKLDQAFTSRIAITSMEVALTLGGQLRHWQIAANPLTDSYGVFTGYRGVVRDVSNEKLAQMQTQIAKESAERASAAKSQFLAIVSHELRTPINAIVGFSELLSRDKDSTLTPKARKEFCDAILESSHHLQVLINDLLDATRMEQDTLKLVEQDLDAAEMVEACIKLCRNQAEKSDVNIVAKLADYITIKADMMRLKQVMINLLTNAIKFSPEGGVVYVEMQRGSDGDYHLAFRDSGVGIPADHIERVFEPFVQVDSSMTRRFGGIGLGLAIARRIARLHQGDITLQSTEGAGTTATLILPKERVTWPKATATIERSVA